MSTPRPKLFIGSSKEAKPIADALHARLEDVAEVTVWDEAFVLSDVTLDKLRERMASTDFAAFVYAADDLTTSRGKTEAMPRDNVILETGMALGVLGRQRTFIVRPRTTQIKMPSDFLGITTATYDDARADGHLPSAVGPTAMKIAEAIKEIGARLDRPATAHAIAAKANAVASIGTTIMTTSSLFPPPEGVTVDPLAEAIRDQDRQPIALKLLLLLAKITPGNGGQSIVNLSHFTGQSALIVQRLLERMVDAKMVHRHLRIGYPTTFSLASAGRDYLIDHGHIK